MYCSEERLVATLNRLIQTCIDDEECFGNAAEQVRDPELRALFSDHSHLRSAMADDLQNLVQSFGKKPTTKGSTRGVVRQALQSVKQAVAGNDETSLLADCRKSQETAVETFRRALSEALPPETEMLVRRQFSVVVATCERLRSLERTLVNAHA